MVRTTRRSTPVLAALAAIALLACDGSPTDTLNPPVSLSISPTELSLVVGGEGRLTAQAIDVKGRTTTPSSSGRQQIPPSPAWAAQALSPRSLLARPW